MKYYKREKTEYGSYIDADGERYAVSWCHAIHSPTRQTPEQLGYEPFESMEDALAAWGLMHWVDPEAEITNDDLRITNDENE